MGWAPDVMALSKVELKGRALQWESTSTWGCRDCKIVAIQMTLRAISALPL